MYDISLFSLPYPETLFLNANSRRYCTSLRRLFLLLVFPIAKSVPVLIFACFTCLIHGVGQDMREREHRKKIFGSLRGQKVAQGARPESVL